MTVTLTRHEFFGPLIPDPSTKSLFMHGPIGRAKELGADPAVTRIVLTDAVVFKAGGYITESKKRAYEVRKGIGGR